MWTQTASLTRYVSNVDGPLASRSPPMRSVKITNLNKTNGLHVFAGDSDPMAEESMAW